MSEDEKRREFFEQARIKRQKENRRENLIKVYMVFWVLIGLFLIFAGGKI